MAKNPISLKGNLTRDPFFDYLDGRDGPVPFMRFTLAVDRHPPRQAGTDYLQVLVYGGAHRNVQNSVSESLHLRGVPGTRCDVGGIGHEGHWRA